MNLEREDCGRCGGTGQVTEMVAGRSGMVPCPGCDNVPKYAVPESPPEDPVARLEEIDLRLTELEAEKKAWKSLRADVGEAKDLIGEVADNDLVGDEASVKLNHIREQIGMVMRHLYTGQSISYQKEQLGREKAKLRTLIDHLEEQTDG